MLTGFKQSFSCRKGRQDRRNEQLARKLAEAMILEEFVGAFVTLVSNLTPPSLRTQRENRPSWLIFQINPEHENLVCSGVEHREYEQEDSPEIPYYEQLEMPLTQTETQPARSFYESLIRSFRANIGLLMAVILILGILTTASVFMKMSTFDACAYGATRNFPSYVRIIHITGTCFSILLLYSWFPISVALLFGYTEFKTNYLSCLCACLGVGAINVIYQAIIFDHLNDLSYSLLGRILYGVSILCGAGLVARKFKKVDTTTSYSFAHIFFIASFTFIASCVIAWIHSYYIFGVIQRTENKIKRAVFVALTPGTALLPTAIGKYIALRKSSEMIPPDRAFVLACFIRGWSITVYRTMQASFQDVWLFVALSLLHGISNVVSKATLNFRIKIWTAFIACWNKICCGQRLDVQPLDSPRVRRFNSDLEIQNILFEYTAAIFSQAFYVFFILMNFDIPPGTVIHASLIRITISLAIDFLFNIISVFIQVHFYDIPMQKVWLKYWRRHVIAAAVIIVVTILYFGKSLVKVLGSKRLSEEHNLRNCTSLFLSF